MEKLNPIIEATPEPTLKQLARRCQAENSQKVWAHLSKLIAELVQHGSIKAGTSELIEKQKTLSEKLADKDPEHVAIAIKLHQEHKPWFPHISDLMLHIRPLEIAQHEREQREKARAAAWHSKKEDLDFIEDDPETRAAAVAKWHSEQKPELAELGQAADDKLLTPAEREARAAAQARKERWRDPANDPQDSIDRLKASMTEHSELLNCGAD